MTAATHVPMHPAIIHKGVPNSWTSKPASPNPPTSHTATMTASAAAVAFASLFV